MQSVDHCNVLHETVLIVYVHSILFLRVYALIRVLRHDPG